ncbi:hypothetical protein CRM22_000970 [Opisthorchis felineus]|uniref:Transmembrane protein 50A n=1 Tax=Opisthorchis felineus TaxID=147828 RepID=A0A4S2MJD3_OPIFE|nr:hypothetical protein CRM22_000970 [Opisthorchis felineus]
MAIQECFERCEVENPRNLFVSILSGFVFALAWWIAIDAASIYSTDQLPGAYHTPGVFGTIAFVLVNMVPNSALQDDYGERRIGRRGAFFCLFFAFLVSFSCVIASCWILFGAYVAVGSSNVWPGVAILLQNLLLCAASLTFRFGRKQDD